MRLQGAFAFTLLLIGSVVVPGCGSDSFLPPPPSGRPQSAPVYSSSIAGAKEVVMILPVEDNSDISAWESIARQEAGLNRLGFRSVRPSVGDPPAKQADLIRDAARTAAGLLVVTNRSSETTAALAALDPKKTPVILLGRTLPASPEAAKVKATLVTYPSYAESAKKLAGYAMDDARKRVDLAKGVIDAAVIRSKFKDETSDLRAQALTEAAKALGLNVVDDRTFDGTGESFARMLEQVVKEHPRVAVLLCEEEAALSGITIARQEITKDHEGPSHGQRKAEGIIAPAIDPKKDYKLVGYVTTRTNATLARLGQVSAVCDRSISAVGREAIFAIRDILDGKTVPAKIEVPLQIIRSQNDPAMSPKL